MLSPEAITPEDQADHIKAAAYMGAHGVPGFPGLSLAPS